MRSIWNIWVIIGLSFTVIGIYILLNQFILYRQCTEQTQGIIGTAYQLGMQYRTLNFTVNGEEYTEPLSESNYFSVGQTITIVYNPNNLKQHYIFEDKPNISIVGLGVTIGGIILMLCGYGLYTGFFPESQVRHLFRK